MVRTGAPASNLPASSSTPTSGPGTVRPPQRSGVLALCPAASGCAVGRLPGGLPVPGIVLAELGHGAEREPGTSAQCQHSTRHAHRHQGEFPAAVFNFPHKIRLNIRAHKSPALRLHLARAAEGSPQAGGLSSHSRTAGARLRSKGTPHGVGKHLSVANACSSLYLRT